MPRSPPPAPTKAMRPSRLATYAAVDQPEAVAPGLDRGASRAFTHRRSTLALVRHAGSRDGDGARPNGRAPHAAFSVGPERADAQAFSRHRAAARRLARRRAGLDRGRAHRGGGSSGREPEARAGAERIAGVALPGVANLHSHTFQRGFAGLTERRGDGRRSFLDLAGGHVPLPAPAHARRRRGHRGPGLRRDAGRRLLRRGGIPLPAPPAGRAAL